MGDYMNKRRDLLLNKYFKIDNAKKLAYLDLHYEKASDILDLSMSKDEYLFNDDVINSVNNLIKMIPSKYKVVINLNIDDYESFNEEELVRSFNDTIEMNYYQREKLVKYRNLKVGYLVMIGILILSLMVYVKANYQSENISKDILAEVIDITAWVFIWEAVTVAFLSELDLVFDSRLLLVRVKNLNIIRNGNVTKTYDLLKESTMWDYTSKIKKLVNMLYLFTGIVFFGLGVEGFIKLVDNTYREQLIGEPILLTTQSLLCVCEMFAGIGISFVYLGIENKTFKRFISIFNFIIIFQIVISIINRSNSDIELTELGEVLMQGHLIYLVTVIIYIVSRILERLLELREAKIEERERQFTTRLSEMFTNEEEDKIELKKTIEEKKKIVKKEIDKKKNTWKDK